MAETLHDYAAQVVFRANVHAKSRLTLSQHPTSKTEVKVSIGKFEVPADEKWYYDAATNSVVLRWYLLEQGQWKPGDVIRVSY